MPYLPRVALPAFLLLASHLSLHAQNPKCGTGAWMKRQKETHQSLKLSARTSFFSATPVRTLETDHFVIHYVLRGPNRVRTQGDDRALVSLADSLYASLAAGGMQGRGLDSAVHARLDAADAGHPLYIRTMAAFFEAARGYYVDTLGMKEPSEVSPSTYYRAKAHPQGKYPVDVADIGTADPGFRGQEIYALTYPAGFGGMLMENDFLFRSEVGPDGIPRGDSISSRYQGDLVHNYAAEWDLGLKVTCYHELYHSVQFAYTPSEQSYHIWYETSATGMEERKAPEVDDYLQYLPAYMDDLADRGMLAFPEGGLSRYGNGIYYVFLAAELGEDFDARLWRRLAENGNDIREALQSTHAAYGKNLSETYARFGAQLAFSGTDAANPLPAFSPDLPRWPRLKRDTVDLSSQPLFESNRRHPPLSIRGLGIASAGVQGKSIFHKDTVMRTVLARLKGDASVIDFRRGRAVSLDPAGEDGRLLAVFVHGGTQRIVDGPTVGPLSSRADSEVYAYPNPINRAGGESALLFSRHGKPAKVAIYAENGSLVRALTFEADSELWTWDLSDDRGAEVKQGVYYYRVDSEGLKTLHIR
jgi:hypothetical protein